MSPAVIGTAGLLIAVLGDLTAESARLLVAAKRRGIHGVALLLATEDWDPRGVDRPATTLRACSCFASAGWRVVVVHAGDDLAAAVAPGLQLRKPVRRIGPTPADQIRRVS